MLILVAPVIADESSSPAVEITPAPTTSSEPIPETTPAAEPSEVPIPIDSTQASPAASPEPNGGASVGSPSSPAETSSALSQKSPSPTPTLVAPLKNQSMRLSVPSVLPVDPRATSRSLPALVLTGPRYLLACIEGSELSFDIYLKNSVQSNFNNEQLVSGDRSSQLLISGTTDQVVAIVNSYSGLKVVSTKSAIGGLSARISFVAMNEPTLDSSFCGQGSPANLRVIQFRSLQLEKNLIKNSVDLKR
jgi:hypothetical protein